VRLAASQNLYSYWNSLRAARRAPERSEIDPAAIRGVLADTFILEVDPALRYPLRIAGTRTNCLFLRELRGSPFLDLWRNSDRREVGEILESVCDDAVAVVAGATARPTGLAGIELELLFLPLRHHGDTHARILGSCTPAAHAGWLGLLPVGPLELLSMRVLGPFDRPTRERPDQSSQALMGAVNFSARAQPDRRGHLFVIDGAIKPT